MQNSIVVSVAFREMYVRHSWSQQFRIQELDPTLRYWSARDALPYKDGFHFTDIVSHFQQSLYGFKPHMIQKARDKGFSKVIWLDPSVLPTVSLQCIIKALDEHPVITRAGENDVAEMTNQKAKKWFGVSDEELKGVKHVAGTIYAFNFDNPKAVEVFELWMKAEQEGIFGDQDAFMAGHWADEACMALSLYRYNVPQVWVNEFNYLNQKEL